MKKLYTKSELYFAITWIAIYCCLQSFALSLDNIIGIKHLFSALFAIAQTIILFHFLYKNSLFKTYNLCLSPQPAKHFLYYLPLLVLASSNLWNGTHLRDSCWELNFYICLMLCTGFLEELIFRGFLFRALAKNNLTWAIAISSITFGIGHILNTINGNKMAVTTNLLQIIAAIAFGLLFVTLVYRGKSLLPCIITHATINILAAFSKEMGLSPSKQLVFLIIQLLIITIYIFILNKTLPKSSTTQL